jgi:hypothetical protein
MKPIQFSAGKRTSTPHQINGVFNAIDTGPNKHGNFAALPGTGPTGEMCKGCDFIRHNKNATQWGRCKLAADMRRVTVGKLAMISLLAPACGKWKKRNPEDKPWMHRDDFKMTEKAEDEPRMF